MIDVDFVCFHVIPFPVSGLQGSQADSKRLEGVLMTKGEERRLLSTAVHASGVLTTPASRKVEMDLVRAFG